MAIAFGIWDVRWPRATVMIVLTALAGWTIARSGVCAETVAVASACLLVYLAAGFTGVRQLQPKLVRVVALGWFLAAAASTAIALCQYFGIADAFEPWFHPAHVAEAFGNLRQRNQFASLTVIGMVSLFFLLEAGLPRSLALLAMAWLALGNAATTSRTGLTQLALLGALAGVWPGPRRGRMVLWTIGLLAYLFAAIVLPWLLEIVTGAAANRIWDRVASGDACGSRMILWSNVLHLIAQKPWIGWGWGELDYAHYVTLYDGLRFCDILDNAHNLPLHLAVELGVPAAVIVCGALAWAVVRAKPWREADPARQMAWAVLAVIGVHSLVEYPLWYGPFQIAFGLCLGILWPARNAQVRPGALIGERQVGAGLLAACAIAACAYAAWDYHRVSQIYLPVEARMQAYRNDPLPKIRQSWLFHNQAAFAELTLTPLTRTNAQWAFDTAAALLHYSPEPRVIEKLIESATMLGRYDEALFHLMRLRAAFPPAYKAWSQEQVQDLRPQP